MFWDASQSAKWSPEISTCAIDGSFPKSWVTLELGDLTMQLCIMLVKLIPKVA